MEGLHADVVIVGGGAMGCSLAYHLMNDGFAGEVLVVERDPLRERNSTALSAGGIRQQFGTAVNIRLSRYSVDFYEHWHERTEVEGESTPINFRQRGYLFLADAGNATVLARRAALQRSLGVEVEELTPGQVHDLVPDLDVSRLQGANFGRRDGYLDPYSVMKGFEAKARQLGAHFLVAEAAQLLQQQGRVTGLRLTDGRSIKASVVVDAAGAWAAELAASAGLSLPIAPQRHSVYVARSGRWPELSLPMTICPSGLYFREEQPGYVLVGKSQPDDPVAFDFGVDRRRFEELWFELAEWMPVFDQLRLEHAWSGLYEMNTADANAIIGEQPELRGFYVIAGFSGHGMMQAPGAGKALSELIRLGRYETVDLRELSPERFATGRLVVEDAVI